MRLHSAALAPRPAQWVFSVALAQAGLQAVRSPALQLPLSVASAAWLSQARLLLAVTVALLRESLSLLLRLQLQRKPAQPLPAKSQPKFLWLRLWPWQTKKLGPWLPQAPQSLPTPLHPRRAQLRRHLTTHSLSDFTPR